MKIPTGTSEKTWNLFEGQPIAYLTEKPVHLIFVVDETMIGDTIEVWGKARYTCAETDQVATFHPNSEVMAALFFYPRLIEKSREVALVDDDPC